MIRKTGLLLALALLLPACSLPRADMPAIDTWRLEAPRLAPADGITRPSTLAIDLAYVAPELVTQSIVIQRRGYRLDEVANARWPVPLPAYVKQQLIRGFAAGEGFRLVADAPVGGAVNHQLRLELLDLQLEETDDDGLRAHVRIHGVLQRLDEVSDDSETVIRAEAEVPVAERRVSAILPAMNRAFEDAAAELAAGVFAALP